MPALPKNSSPVVQTKQQKASPPEPAVHIPTEDVERKIIYPKVTVNICSGEKALTDEQGKALLGWEDEFDYQARIKAENPKLKTIANFGEEYLFKDFNGRKVRCWNNNKNRPFDWAHCMKLCQDILEGRWEFNLENIIISLTGLVTSGQHRLIAFVIACQRWASQKEGAYWRERFWKTARPTIECTVAFGGSEKPEVLRTIDNVKPRTLEDVFYTSEIFRDLGSTERKECARMMDYAIDLLWKRTEIAKGPTLVRYQTHSSSIEFSDAHPTLKEECISTIFLINKDRVLSKLRLSAGHCAAMLYLMGSSTTDVDETLYMEKRNEEAVNWDNWDKAVEYWTMIGKADLTHPMRKALGDLQDAEGGLKGRLIEKLAILIKGWHLYVADEEITEEGLALEYGKDKNGNTILVDPPTCGGIDFGGSKVIENEPELTPEQIEANAKAEREEKAKATVARIEAKKKAPPATAVKPGELLSEADKKLIEQRKTKTPPATKRPAAALKVAGK